MLRSARLHPLLLRVKQNRQASSSDEPSDRRFAPSEDRLREIRDHPHR
jgi:hypothetical protein